MKYRYVGLGVVCMAALVVIVPLAGGYESHRAGKDTLRVTAIGPDRLECPSRRRTRRGSSNTGSCINMRTVVLVAPDRKRTELNIPILCLAARAGPLRTGDTVEMGRISHSGFGRTWETYDRSGAERFICQGGGSPREVSIARTMYDMRLAADKQTCSKGRAVTSTGLDCHGSIDNQKYLSSYYDRILPRLAIPSSLPFPDSGRTDLAWEERREANPVPVQVVDRSQSPEDKVVKFIPLTKNRYSPGKYSIVYLSAGDARPMPLLPGRRYAVRATAGRTWLGADLQFGRDGTTVDLGTIDTSGRMPVTLVLGSEDRPVKVITNDRF